MEGGSESGGEAVVYSGDKSSTGETNSIYQVQDGGLGGCSDGDSVPDPYEPPHRVTIFMAGTQSGQDSTTAAAMISGSATVTAAGVGGRVHPPAQVLSDLLDALTTLLTAEVTPANQTQHNAEVAKLRDEIA